MRKIKGVFASMRTTQVADNLYWVGAVDWNIRDFHGYSTERGTTYNSYLLMDDKITLFDTVKQPYRGELWHNIKRIVDPAKIDYIVVNHVEMDHSGALPEMMKMCNPEKLFCSTNGKRALLDHFHNEDWPYEVVKSGDTLSTGKKTIQFLETKMLHWPDSMFSYIEDDKVLISSDAFGQHWATSERFNNEVDQPELFRHAAKYYANILLPFSDRIQKLIETVSSMGLEFKMICPDHGLIWRENPAQIISSYGAWSQQSPQKKALIIYETMWNSTEWMAKSISRGIASQGVSVKMMNIKQNHRSDIMTEVMDTSAIVVGSATLNNGYLAGVADFLNYMKGLKPANKLGAAFGSYGWSGEAVKLINAQLEEMKFSLIDEKGLRVKYVPGHEDLKECVKFGETIGKAITGK